MLMNNKNKKNNDFFVTSDTIYQKTNFLYTQPKLFNIINASKKEGFKLGLYTLFIPLFFFNFYKSYIASIDIVLLCTLIILNYIIRPAVNNNIIKNVSYHTEFKIKTLTKILILIRSSIYRLLLGLITQIGNVVIYKNFLNFPINTSININTNIIICASFFSLITISMFLFPATLNVSEYHKHMKSNLNNEIEKENDKKRINNSYNNLGNEYKAFGYSSMLKSSNHPSTNTNTNTNNKSKTETSVKKSDRRRRIF